MRSAGSQWRCRRDRADGRRLQHSTCTASNAADDWGPHGSVIGGCFGYLGPPSHWAITVTARQNGQAKASTQITEVKSDHNGGPYTMLGGYRLDLPAGTYEITATGPGLHGPGGAALLGTVSVQPGHTVTNRQQVAVPSC